MAWARNWAYAAMLATALAEMLRVGKVKAGPGRPSPAVSCALSAIAACALADRLRSALRLRSGNEPSTDLQKQLMDSLIRLPVLVESGPPEPVEA